MRGELRHWLFVLAPAIVLAVWTIGATAFFAWTLAAGERAALVQWIAPRIAPLLFLWMVLAIGLGIVMQASWRRRIAAPARLAEQARALAALAAVGDPPEVVPQGSAENRALADVINALLRERSALHADIGERVRSASREVERQRSRLAALMAELANSVVVCTLDGVILLYNRRARLQFAEAIELGRSIHAVFDPALLAHALEIIGSRLHRGDAHPSVQFLAGTRDGQLLRVQMVPVHEPEGDADHRPAPAFAGYVLMLEDVTGAFAEAERRDRLLDELIEGSRASLGTLQAAVEMLDYPDVDDATRERFRRVVRDEMRTMGTRLHSIASRVAQMQKTRWPLEDVAGADLLGVAGQRIESQHGCRVVLDDVDATLWLRVDGFSLLQALAYLSGRLVDEHSVRVLRLRLTRAERHAHLDLAWHGVALSTETATNWEIDSMRVGPQASALSVRDVVERHGGALWFERERARQTSFFRFLLPLAHAPHATDEPEAAADAEAGPRARTTAADSRPAFYDFDLFRTSRPAAALADRELTELTFTVFDTETTGMDPTHGDRIVQIGATRIVAGKLRRHECFERLVDPQRDVPATSSAIHGIDAQMLVGKPCIEEVLPEFHAWARDSVLIAHNAAFDMRFLQQAEAASGVVFDQPVLDTLLLSVYAHPAQESHALEAIAARLGIAPPSNRHAALGDALLTAEIFLKLIPILAERGVRTLQQARDAAQQTWHARLRY